MFTLNLVQTIKKASSILVTTVKSSSMITKMLLVLSFIAPFTILYALEPPLFEKLWIGRTFYLFFLWLIILEIMLNWENLQNSKLEKIMSIRAILFSMLFIMPTLYVLWANYLGLNDMIRNLAQQNNMKWENALLMRLPVEYLVFTLLFALMVTLAYGIRGLKDFSTSVLFLGIIGTIYTIDTIYPGNTFTPFQVLVPATTHLSAIVLNTIGYHTSIVVENNVRYGVCPILTASNMKDSRSFMIAWACSGIESLLIYSVVMALFLKAGGIRRIYKVACFLIGALITYFINILRVAMIFVIELNGGNFQEFHDYYGPLLSIFWITSYPLIIMGIHALSARFGNMRRMPKQVNLAVS